MSPAVHGQCYWAQRVASGHSKWRCPELVQCGPSMVLHQLRDAFNSFVTNNMNGFSRVRKTFVRGFDSHPRLQSVTP